MGLLDFLTKKPSEPEPTSEPKAPNPKSWRGYSGAKINNLTADWIMAPTNADAEIRSSLRALRDRSRSLERDNDYVKSAYREITNNVVFQGIPFQSQVTKLRKKGETEMDQRLNDLIEAAWAKWVRKENCDAAGKLDFYSIQRLIMHSISRDGEIVIRKVRKRFGSSKVPFALEVFESDHIDEQYNGMYGNNRVIMGVEMNEWSRPVAYHILRNHPGDSHLTRNVQTGKRERVDAKDILHPFLTDRAKQTRGVPWIHAGVIRIRHLGGYEEAEVVGARAASCAMGFVVSPDGDVQGDNEDGGGEKVWDFEPNVIRTLSPGEDIRVPNMARPGASVDPFIRTMLRGLATGLGVSYETLTGDYSQSNYSSSRLSLTKERDNWRVLQKWFILNFCQPIFEEWLSLAVLSGEIDLPNFYSIPERYQAVKWQPRGWSFIDPQKEVQANKDMVLNGFSTLSEIIAMGGGDFEDLVHQRKRELQLMESVGIQFLTDPSIEAEQSKKNPPAESASSQSESAPKESPTLDESDSSD